MTDSSAPAPHHHNQKNHNHVVCVPFPAQGHINPMMKLAKILHQRGFHITFVNTEFNHRRLLKTRGSSFPLLPRFSFETIPDGLPPSSSHPDSTQSIPSLCLSTSTSCLPHFRLLLHRLSSSSPPITALISDGMMTFTLDVSPEFSIPNFLFWTCSATSGICGLHYSSLLLRGITPFKHGSCFTDGYMDNEIDWIPEIDRIRIRDIPTFIRTTDPDDIMLRFIIKETSRTHRARALIINTFDSLEKSVIEQLPLLAPRAFSLGPLSMMADAIVKEESVRSIGSNLWAEDEACLKWLDSKEKGSLVYINFGSITVLTGEQLG